jgi:hypothetical protein
LASLLRSLANRGGPFGSAGEHALLKLAAALDVEPDGDVEAVLQYLAQHQAPPVVQKQAKRREVDQDVVSSYVSALESAKLRTENDVLKLIEILEKDKRARASEVDLIARRTTGRTAKYPSKTAALKDLADVFKRREWDRDRVAQVAKG